MIEPALNHSVDVIAGSPRSPHGRARGLYAIAYESLLYPSWQRAVRGRPVGAHLQILAATQWLTPEERDRLQLDSLRALLAHAGRNVKYWGELFAKLQFDPRGVRSATDLSVLPVLTREVISERYDDLVDPAHRGRNIRKGTSGTSGVPLKFEYCNESEAWRQAVRLRGYGWAGYRMGLPTVHYWGAGSGLPSGLAGGKIQLDRALKREVYVDAIQQDEASLRSAAAIISRMKPHCIIAYTQALAGFARWAIDRGARDWPDARVLCAAEALLPRDREAIARAFGPAVFETYGSRETMLVAAECESHDGMHLSEENLVVEIVREGRPVPAGQAGDVLVTDLHNYGMPFIRYANGDLATMSTAAGCACGRGLRKLARVEGRQNDTMRDANGDPVPGMLVISLLASEAGLLREFQCVQKAGGGVELKIVRGRDWDEARFQKTVRRIEPYFKGLPLSVSYCDEIPASKSGKRHPIRIEANADSG
jgi:phenylacetate-coenzyme A ligase PaaK-like adenylate-forming protein